jgi:hypothetical protein
MTGLHARPRPCLALTPLPLRGTSSAGRGWVAGRAHEPPPRGRGLRAVAPRRSSSSATSALRPPHTPYYSLHLVRSLENKRLKMLLADLYKRKTAVCKVRYWSLPLSAAWLRLLLAICPCPDRPSLPCSLHSTVRYEPRGCMLPWWASRGTMLRRMEFLEFKTCLTKHVNVVVRHQLFSVGPISLNKAPNAPTT